MDFIEAPLYTPEPGDRIRVLLKYGGEWRPVFWFAVGGDGSVYLGPRFANISVLRKGSKEIKQGQLTINYEEGQDVSKPDLLKNPKVSFHGSGTIIAADERFFRDPLRSLKQQQLLCGTVFMNLGRYAPVHPSRIGKRDICLRYPVDKERPLYGFMYVAPVTEARLVRQPSATYQVNLLLSYSGLQRMPDTVVQLVLAHGPTGPWPPYAYVFFGTSLRRKLA